MDVASTSVREIAGTRTPSWRLVSPAVAWLLAALIVVLLAGYAVLAAVTHELTFASNFWLNVLVIAPVAAVGLLVAARQPGNPIGWIFLAEAVLYSLGSVAGQYAVLAYRMGHHLPWGPAAALLALYWSPVIVTFPAVILLFLDGRVPSRRRQRFLVAYLAVGAAWPASIYAVAIRAIAGQDIHVIPGGDLQAVDYPSGGSAWLSTVEAVVLPVLAVFWAVFVFRQVLAWRQAGGPGPGTRPRIGVDQPAGLKHQAGQHNNRQRVAPAEAGMTVYGALGGAAERFAVAQDAGRSWPWRVLALARIAAHEAANS